MAPDEDKSRQRFHVDEGWYTDPWGRHEGRWISAGVATDLVRDGDIESRDAPPKKAPTISPTLIQTVDDADDLKRADDAESEFIDSDDLRRREVDAAEEGIDSTPGG